MMNKMIKKNNQSKKKVKMIKINRLIIMIKTIKMKVIKMC